MACLGFTVILKLLADIILQACADDGLELVVRIVHQEQGGKGLHNSTFQDLGSDWGGLWAPFGIPVPFSDSLFKWGFSMRKESVTGLTPMCNSATSKMGWEAQGGSTSYLGTCVQSGTTSRMKHHLVGK